MTDLTKKTVSVIFLKTEHLGWIGYLFKPKKGIGIYWTSNVKLIEGCVWGRLKQLNLVLAGNGQRHVGAAQHSDTKSISTQAALMLLNRAPCCTDYSAAGRDDTHTHTLKTDVKYVLKSKSFLPTSETFKNPLFCHFLLKDHSVQYGMKYVSEIILHNHLSV